MEVFVRDRVALLRARSGAEVSSGDQLRFRVRAPQGGHLVIAGIDDTRVGYRCFPDDLAGMSAPLAADTRQPFADGRGVFGWLDVEVLLDDTPGHERLVAVLCAEPFRYDGVAASLLAATASEATTWPLPRLLPSCSQHALLLSKREGSSSERAVAPSSESVKARGRRGDGSGDF